MIEPEQQTLKIFRHALATALMAFCLIGCATAGTRPQAGESEPIEGATEETLHGGSDIDVGDVNQATTALDGTARLWLATQEVLSSLLGLF